MLDLKGIIPALISPKDEDENLNTEPVAKVLEFDIERGISGVFIGGSNGEGFCQTNEERKRMTETVVQAVAGRVPVVIHVGGLNFREIIELSRHSGEKGADAVSSVIPFYYKYSLEEVRAFYQTIAEASGLPVIIYALTHVATSTFPADEFIDAMLSVDRIYGIKFTNPDLARMQTMKQLSGERLRFYGGVDVLPLPMLCMGADGMIGSNYSGLPEPWVAVYDAFQAGDLETALRMQDRITYYVRCFNHLWGPNRPKNVLKARGLDVGDVWLPKGPSTEADLDLCRRVMEEITADPVFAGHIKQ